MLWTGLAALGGFGAALGWRWYRQPVLSVEQLEALWSAELTAPDGAPFALTGFRGRPLVVNFWATWCSPCVAEMPLLDSFFRQNQSKNWQVLGLAIDRSERVRHFLDHHSITYPVAMTGADGIDLIHRLGNPSGGLPFTLVLQPDGGLIQAKLGKLSEEEIENWSKIVF